VREEIREHLLRLLQNTLFSTVVFVGHSLGGAICSLAAVDMSQIFRDSSIKVKTIVYTIGAPKSGDDTFVELYHRLVSESWRIVNKRDPITKLPLRSPMMKYSHTGHLVYFCRRDGIEGYSVEPFQLHSPSVSSAFQPSLYHPTYVSYHTLYLDSQFPTSPKFTLAKQSLNFKNDNDDDQDDNITDLMTFMSTIEEVMSQTDSVRTGRHLNRSNSMW